MPGKSKDRESLIENENILVLGGSGFLGPELINTLVRNYPNCPVTVFNRGNQNQRILHQIKHIKGDRRYQSDLFQLKKGSFHYVFDLSGLFPETIPTLLDILGKTVKKYVFISSVAVYLNHLELADEKAPTGISPVWGRYGKQKIDCEKKLTLFWQNPGDLIILRPAYIVGFTDQIYRENRLLNQIREGKPIYVSNKGQERIQFVHKDDLISICCQMLTPKAVASTGVFNVASDQVFSVNSWFQHMVKPFDLEPKLEYVPFSENSRRLFPYLPADVAVTSQKIETVLGIKLSNDFSKLAKKG